MAGPGATGRDREESRGPGRCAGVRLDIWTDIVCPFCYLGRARLEEAVAGFEHRDEVELVWHSFELDRDAPAVSEQTVVDLVAQKYGASREQMVAQHESLAAQMRELGLPVDFDRARHGNTFDAHRVVHLATEHGLGGEMHARLLRAYFAEGLAIATARCWPTSPPRSASTATRWCRPSPATTTATTSAATRPPRR